MNYRLDFESDQLKGQEPIRMIEIEDMRKKLEQTIGIAVGIGTAKSRREEGKFHFWLESDADIDVLLNAVDGKTEQIKKIGIETVTLWGLYEYCGQCNMEWEVDQLLKMGRNEIKFCVSCWEKEPPEIYKAVLNSIKHKFHNDKEIEHIYAYWDNEDKQFIGIRTFNNNKKEEIEKYVKDVYPSVDFVDVEVKQIKLPVDICLREGCGLEAQTSYRLCPKHLREAHAAGFDDSNK